MRKIRRSKHLQRIAGVALALTAAAGAASAASADTREVVGKIQHLNPRGHHITVKSATYRYDPRLMGVGLHRGDTVRIVFRERHGHRYAVQILPAA
jgi:hypothetical protein